MLSPGDPMSTKTYQRQLIVSSSAMPPSQDVRIIKPEEIVKPKLGELTAPLWDKHSEAFNKGDYEEARRIKNNIDELIRQHGR